MFQPENALLHVDQASRESNPKEGGERLSSAKSEPVGKSRRQPSLVVENGESFLINVLEATSEGGTFVVGGHPV